MCRKRSPPLGDFAVLAIHSFVGGFVIASGRFAPHASDVAEEVLDDVQQFIESAVVDRVFDSGIQAEVASESEDVPRIHQGTAFDGAADQIECLFGDFDRIGEAIRAEGSQSQRHPTINAAHQSSGSGRNHIGLLGRRIGVTQASVDARQLDVLQLDGAAACERRIQVLASSPEGLMSRFHFVEQTLAVLATNLRNSPVVKLIAEVGDWNHQRSKRHIAAVTTGAPTGDARCHQHRAGQDRSGFFKQFVTRQFWRFIDSCEQRIQGHAAKDEPIVASIGIDRMFIPSAEVIVRSAIDRMVKVIRSWVQAKLTQLVWIHCRGTQNVLGSFFDRSHRTLDQFAIRSGGDASALDHLRDRSNEFVSVRLARTIFEDCDWAVADIVVQRADDLTQASGFVVHAADGFVFTDLLHHDFGTTSQEETVEEQFRRLVEQQVAMEIQVGRQESRPKEIDQTEGAINVCKRGRAFLQRLGGFFQPVSHDQEWRRPIEDVSAGSFVMNLVPS